MFVDCALKYKGVFAKLKNIHFKGFFDYLKMKTLELNS